MATTVDHITPGIAAETFFKDYISRRRPVVLSGLPDDASFQATKWTDLNYLASKAGDVEVLVEPMHASIRQFGTDVQRIPMRFRNFLDSLKQEDGPHHYLTTQYSGEEWDSLTVLSPPTDALSSDFPDVPPVMGNLFLQQANLWIGKSKEGSSSGLHHDFHDNLYCLLKGRKRFVLFPPKEHVNLYPNGTVHKLYGNGVITYDPILRADGLDQRVALQAKVEALQKRLDALPVTKGKGKGKAKTDTRERQALQEALDKAQKELKSYTEDDEDGFLSSISDDEEDGSDLEGKVLDDDDLGSLAGDLEDGHDDYDALIAGLDENGDNEEPSSPSVGGSKTAQNGAPANTTSDEPASFSRIPTAYLHRQLNLPTTAVPPGDTAPSDFPDLVKAAPPYIVELKAGEMLYLPASWWHEVTSFSAGEGEGEGGDVHMAFNYWFYPPDAETFEEPYADKIVWEHLREKAAKERHEGRGNGELADDTLDNGKRKREEGEGKPQKKAKH
ncbi:Clavaminate synthase-like protein [Laetiporus sulphureus 93-53]|uniref:Clavaminate synthase-like protein n=1 Tax=Laetiporus sulphureus 93-53 TaxID=1314785 RepID=A0A165DLL6_9APHY|nr:Clavaminate synthase-like protein [Laetiporus sulphureus 93-53]KZT05153.1 Clavaminate synthase-like protein [Laetiporus sulphureus 93-53]